MTKEECDTLKYYDEIFIKASLDKRIEDYCNKKHLYRLYGDKPVVMKEIKTSLKEFAKQETELLSIQLTKAKEIIKKYLAIGVGGKITQNYLDVTKEAEQFISEVEK